MRKIIALGAAVGVVAALVGFSPANAGENHKNGHARAAELSVLHAIPNLPVDVYVNGALTLNDFTPGTLSDTLSLKAGMYSVAITAADAPNADNPLLGPVKLTLRSGQNYTAVAHLAEEGTPTVTLFQNDLRPVRQDSGRLTVRHVAAAPAVDVLANGTPAITNLTNPQQAELTLPTGTISASVAATGTTVPLIGPADVTIAKRTNTIVYAWGSLADGNLAFAVQTVKLVNNRD